MTTIFLAIKFLYADAPGQAPDRAFTSRDDAEAYVRGLYYGGRVQEIDLVG